MFPPDFTDSFWEGSGRRQRHPHDFLRKLPHDFFRKSQHGLKYAKALLQNIHGRVKVAQIEPRLPFSYVSSLFSQFSLLYILHAYYLDIICILLWGAWVLKYQYRSATGANPRQSFFLKKTPCDSGKFVVTYIWDSPFKRNALCKDWILDKLVGPQDGHSPQTSYMRRIAANRKGQHSLPYFIFRKDGS